MGMLEHGLHGAKLDAVTQANHEYWAGPPGFVWHTTMKRSREEYGKLCARVTSHVRPLVDPENPPEIWEIGSGMGVYLGVLAEAFPEVKRFVGLEINPLVVEACRNDPERDPRAEFVCAADMGKYVGEHCPPGSVIVTVSTLQHMVPKLLVETLASIKRIRACHFVLQELTSIDLDRQLDSDVRATMHEGGGCAIFFSHNYPYILEQIGFEIVRKQVEEQPRRPNVPLSSMVVLTGKTPG